MFRDFLHDLHATVEIGIDRDRDRIFAEPAESTAQSKLLYFGKKYDGRDTRGGTVRGITPLKCSRDAHATALIRERI